MEENKMPSLTLAQAEVAAALYSLTNVDPLPQIDPKEVFPRNTNAHIGARRTFSRLVDIGMIERLTPDHWPCYRVTPRLFEELRHWMLKPQNRKAYENFELSCY